MDVSEIGGRLVGCCPHCSTPYNVPADGDSTGVILELHDQHMADSPVCRAARDSAHDESVKAMESMRADLAEHDQRWKAEIDNHPDNGRTGYWEVEGYEYEAKTWASSAGEAIQKCVASGRFDECEYPRARFLYETLPDVF